MPSSPDATEYVYQNVGLLLDPSPDATEYVYQNVIDRSVIIGAQRIEVLVSAEAPVTPPDETTTTQCDYYPIPGYYKTPVQVGDVANLTIAQTPEGHAILAWIDSTGTDTFYLAIREDFSDIYKDNVVPIEDRRVIRSYDLIQSASIWVDNGQLFAAIQYTITGTPNQSYTQCLIANDAEDPTSWALRGTIDYQADVQIFDIFSCGPVTVIGDTGRWLMPIGTYNPYATAAADYSSLVTSIDRGITWSIVASFRNTPLIFGGTTGPVSDTIAQDPVTGYVYWSHHAGPLGNAFVYRSTDLGATWAVLDSSSYTWQFYASNCTDTLWAALPGGTGWQAWVVTDASDNVNGFTNTGVDIIDSYQNEQFQAIFFPNGRYAIIDKNRVAGLGPMFYVGMVGMGGPFG